MGLQKGMTNNPNGRPKGSENKINYEIREVFKELLDKHIDSISKDIEFLTPKDRINVLLKLSEFVIPKMRSIDFEGRLSTEQYKVYIVMKRRKDELESMTDKELEEELKRLKEDY